MSSADGFTAARADCYSAELVRQAARLNRAYEAAMAARSGDENTRLRQAQSAWTKQRDSKCQEDAGGGGPDILHEGSCRLDMTTERAAKLEQMARYRKGA